MPSGGWPNWVLGNHDRARVASRIGSAQARVAAMLLLTLRGTPTIYQGEEIGMRDVAIPRRSRARSLRAQRSWIRLRPGSGADSDALDIRTARRIHRRSPLVTAQRRCARLERLGSGRRSNAPCCRFTRHSSGFAGRAMSSQSGHSGWWLRRRACSLTRVRLRDQQLLIALNMTDREQVLRTERPIREALLSTYLDRPASSDARRSIYARTRAWCSACSRRSLNEQ